MDTKHKLTITLPEEMADLPIIVIKGTEPGKIILASHPEESGVSFADSAEKKYTFIWKLNGYAKVRLADILWVKAEGSYSTIHLEHGNDMTVSFNLATIGRKLPASDFVRIHRSYIVNLRHVEAMTGNSFRIGGQLLVIGREFREQVLGRFIFLGVRRDR